MGKRKSVGFSMKFDNLKLLRDKIEVFFEYEGTKTICNLKLIYPEFKTPINFKGVAVLNSKEDEYSKETGERIAFQKAFHKYYTFVVNLEERMLKDKEIALKYEALSHKLEKRQEVC